MLCVPTAVRESDALRGGVREFDARGGGVCESRAVVLAGEGMTGERDLGRTGPWANGTWANGTWANGTSANRASANGTAGADRTSNMGALWRRSGPLPPEDGTGCREPARAWSRGCSAGAGRSPCAAGACGATPSRADPRRSRRSAPEATRGHRVVEITLTGGRRLTPSGSHPRRRGRAGPGSPRAGESGHEGIAQRLTGESGASLSLYFGHRPGAPSLDRSTGVPDSAVKNSKAPVMWEGGGATATG